MGSELRPVTRPRTMFKNGEHCGTVLRYYPRISRNSVPRSSTQKTSENSFLCISKKKKIRDHLLMYLGEIKNIRDHFLMHLGEDRNRILTLNVNFYKSCLAVIGRRETVWNDFGFSLTLQIVNGDDGQNYGEHHH